MSDNDWLTAYLRIGNSVMDEKNYYSSADVMRILLSKIAEAGNTRAFCDKHGLNDLTISDYVRFPQLTYNSKTLAALGLKAVTVYERAE